MRFANRQCLLRSDCWRVQHLLNLLGNSLAYVAGAGRGNIANLRLSSF